MNRTIIIIFILVGLAYLGYKNAPQEKGKIVYGEARLSFNFPGREIEAVAIGQRYENIGCSGANATNDFLEACIEDKVCIQTKFECKDTVDKQYLKMLSKGEATTHYVHVASKTEPLKGVVLLWGLTQDESKAVCDQITAKFNADKKYSYIAQCI